MGFSSSKSTTETPKVGLYDLLFQHHKPYDENKTIFVDATDEQKYLTLKDVERMVLSVATGLRRIFGLAKGETVAICSPNELLYPVALHGAVAAGGVTATMGEESTAAALASDLQQSDAKIFITHESVLDRALEAAEQVGLARNRILVFGDQDIKGIRAFQKVLLDHGKMDPPVKCDPDKLGTTVAYLYFTSGSSGRKKAVMVTHAMMASSLTLLERPLSSADVALGYTGFQHSSSLWMTLHASIYFGVKTVILPRFSLEAFCKAVQQFKVTVAFIQPWIASSLMREPMVDQYDLSSIQKLLCGGAASEKSVLVSFFDRFHVSIINMYGLTEALGIFETSPEISMQGGVGRPARGVFVKVVNEAGHEVGVEEQGELWVHCPTMMLGYYKDPAATARAIDADGYFHTGDLFSFNKDNVYFFNGRHKDLIKYKLHHVHPQVIENVLMSNPMVTDCGVVGVYSDKETTELPRAYVTLSMDVKATTQTAKDIRQFVDERVDDPFRLRGGVWIVDNLPRTGSGKVQRRQLVDIEQRHVVAVV